MRPGFAIWPPAVTRWAARVAAAAALAVSLAYVPYRLLDPVGTRQIGELRSELRKTRARKAALEAENAQYRRDIRGLRTDPTVIEDLARDDLGMVRPDEIVIRVVPGDPDAAPEAPAP